MEHFNKRKQGPSPPGTFHILIVNFSYFVIRFLLNSSIVNSDNEIGKKVVTDRMDQYTYT